MRFHLCTTFILLAFVMPQTSLAFDDLSNRWTLDLLFHYARTERTTLFNSENFISRQGAMLQARYEEPIDLFWHWYVGGDVSFARYEVSSSIQVTPQDRMPWQLYAGTGWQFGSMKNFEIFLGAGASSEHYMRAESATQYSFEQTNSLRAHAGFYWRFLSIIGSSAELSFKYSTPITKVEHDNSGVLRYAGILDGNLRLRPYYDSTLSLYGGIRFEDYKTESRNVTYFTSRIYAGFGFHF